MYILGISGNFYRASADPAAVLLKNGEIIAAAEEERLIVSSTHQVKCQRRQYAFVWPKPAFLLKMLMSWPSHRRLGMTLRETCKSFVHASLEGVLEEYSNILIIIWLMP